MGVIEPGAQLTRGGASPGDLLVVSGTVGGAARVLDLLQSGKPVEEQHLLNRPKPRVELGRALVGYASACIDISDGLLADLGHILEASGCGAQIELGNLPTARLLSALADKDRWLYQLSGGDDYELLFTLSQKDYEKVSSSELFVAIGYMTDKNAGYKLTAKSGTTVDLTAQGWDALLNNTEE